MPRGQPGKHGKAQRCFNEAPLMAHLAAAPAHRAARSTEGRVRPGAIRPRYPRKTAAAPCPRGALHPRALAAAGDQLEGARAQVVHAEQRQRSQPPSTLDPSRLGLCSEERAHVSRVRGAVIGPDDMEAGRGSEPARTLARPAWSRLWMVGASSEARQALDISLVSLALLVAVQRELDRAHHAARAARRLDRHLPRRRRPAAEHATLVLLGRAPLRAPSAPGAPSGRPSSLWAQRTSRAPTPLAAA